MKDSESIAKIASYMCVFLIVAVVSHQCRLESSIIEDCQAACESITSEMASVTAHKCICSPKDSEETEWITLPR